MAQYKKRQDGRYHTTVGTGKINAITGKEERISIYGNSLNEFRKKISDTKYELAHGTYADDRSHTVSSYAKIWLDAYKSDVGHSTKNSYANVIKNHFTHINNIHLLDLTKTDIQICMNDASDKLDIPRLIRLTINQILECAIDDGLIYKNVCRGIKLPKKRKSNKRALTTGEIAAISKADLTDMEKAFVSILYYTGCRRGEAIALTKSDFDFQRGSVHINKAISYSVNDAIVGSPKTAAGERWIDLIEPFKGEISHYISSCNSLYLFTNPSGNLLTKSALKRMWERILVKINAAAGGTSHLDKKSKKYVLDIDAVPGLTPHIFRHNYATNLYYARVDLKEAQRLLGHADAKTVIEIYTHLDKEKSSSKNKLQDYYKAI